MAGADLGEYAEGSVGASFAQTGCAEGGGEAEEAWGEKWWVHLSGFESRCMVVVMARSGGGLLC